MAWSYIALVVTSLSTLIIALSHVLAANLHDEYARILQAPLVIHTPHALPMYREEKPATKRRREKDRQDPQKTQRPDPGPAGGIGPGSGGRIGATGGTHLTQYILKNHVRPICGTYHTLVPPWSCACSEQCGRLCPVSAASCWMRWLQQTENKRQMPRICRCSCHCPVRQQGSKCTITVTALRHVLSRSVIAFCEGVADVWERKA